MSTKFQNDEDVKIIKGKYKGNRAKYIERVMDYGYVTKNSSVKIYVDEEFILLTEIPLKHIGKSNAIIS